MSNIPYVLKYFLFHISFFLLNLFKDLMVFYLQPRRYIGRVLFKRAEDGIIILPGCILSGLKPTKEIFI